MPPHFRSRNILALRGAAAAAALAFLFGLFEWVTDAWAGDYGLDVSWMLLMSLGYGVFAAAGYYAKTSIEVVLEDDRIRFRTGTDLLTKKWRSVSYDLIHTGVITHAQNGFSRVSPTITLLYRSPQRKMMAVPLTLPLAHVDDPLGLFDGVAERIDVTWKEKGGELEAGSTVGRSEARHAIEIMGIAHPLPERNESDVRLVIDEKTGSDNPGRSSNVKPRDSREISS